MEKTRIMPDDFWDWPLPTTFSQGWRIGNLVFVGGQVSQTAEGKPLHLHRWIVLVPSPQGQEKSKKAWKETAFPLCFGRWKTF